MKLRMKDVVMLCMPVAIVSFIGIGAILAKNYGIEAVLDSIPPVLVISVVLYMFCMVFFIAMERGREQ